MASIYDIPKEDIVLFLSKNKGVLQRYEEDKYLRSEGRLTTKEPGENQEVDYLRAKNLIMSGKAKYYPNSIIDWIIAYNLIKSKKDKNIIVLKESIINSLSLKELNDLVKLLKLDLENFDNTNFLKISIINILFYLGKFDKDQPTYFDILPSDIKLEILQNADINEIDKLCKLSEDFKNVCNSKEARFLLISRFSDDDNLDVFDYTNDELIRYYKILPYKKTEIFDLQGKFQMLSKDGKSIKLGHGRSKKRLSRPANQFVLCDIGMVILYTDGSLFLYNLAYNTEKRIPNLPKLCAIFKTKTQNDGNYFGSTVILVSVEGDYYFLDQNSKPVLLEKTPYRIKKYLSGYYRLTPKETNEYYK